jgi:putative ABC transport system permease protein
MIALPIMALVTAGILMVSSVPSEDEYVTVVMGSADYVVSTADDGRDLEVIADKVPWGPYTLERDWHASFVENGTYVPLSIHDVTPNDPVLGSQFTLLDGRVPVRPGEIDVSPTALEIMRLEIGDSFTAGRDGPTFVIVGTAIDNERFHQPVGLVVPRSLDDMPDSHTNGLFGMAPGIADSQIIETLTSLGGTNVFTRSGLTASHKQSDSPAAMTGIAFAVAALVLVETGLVAAAAFVVGTNRRLRTIGLVGAIGGDRRHLRGVVSTQGVVLGLAGSALGVFVGLVVAFIARPRVNWMFGRITHETRVPLVLIVGAVLLGTVAAVVAAHWPARMAEKLDTMSALAGRTAPTRQAGRLARWGLTIAVIGVGMVAWGTISRSGAVTAVGMVAAILGTLGAVPLLVALVGRLSRGAGTTVHIAGRDTARNARRASAAIAAAAVALTLPVAAATITLSQEVASNAQPALAENEIMVSFGAPYVDAAADEVTAKRFITAFGTEVDPDAHLAVVRQAMWNDASLDDVPGGAVAYAIAIMDSNEAAVSYRGVQIAVGDPGLLDALGVGSFTNDLQRGLAVVLRPNTVTDGEIQIEDPHGIQGGPGGPSTLAIAAVDASKGRSAESMDPGVIVSPELADTLGLLAAPPSGIVIRTNGNASEYLAATKTLASRFDNLYATGLEDTRRNDTPFRLVLLGFAAVTAAVIVAVALALLASEARHDRAILAAIGADAGARRRIAAARAALVTLLAGIIAVPAGFIPATAIDLASRQHYPLVVPWVSFAGVLVVLPLLVGLGAGLLSRPVPTAQLLRPVD